MSNNFNALHMQHATADWFTIKEAIKISKKNRLYKNKKK
jgi:hypothetical protein